MIFKRETDHNEDKSEDRSIESQLSIFGTYKLMWRLLKLAPVKQLVIILLTHNIGLATESINSLKLIEYGVPKENLSLMAIPTMPLQIIIPLLIAKYTNGSNSLSIFYWSIPGRLLMTLLYCGWVYITPYFRTGESDFPTYYYLLLFILNIFDYTFWYGISISQVSFFAQISDEVIGGTCKT
jgi:PAT family acetyl-CoA transporter-like MFS transporter 1